LAVIRTDAPAPCDDGFAAGEAPGAARASAAKGGDGDGGGALRLDCEALTKAGIHAHGPQGRGV